MTFTLKGLPEQARELRRQLNAGFDIAYSYTKREKAPFPHAIANTQLFLDYDNAGTKFPYPIVPITVNCYGQHAIARRGGLARFAEIRDEHLDPVGPSPNRCFQLGAAVARFLTQTDKASRWSPPPAGRTPSSSTGSGTSTRTPPPTSGSTTRSCAGTRHLEVGHRRRDRRCRPARDAELVLPARGDDTSSGFRWTGQRWSRPTSSTPTNASRYSAERRTRNDADRQQPGPADRIPAGRRGRRPSPLPGAPLHDDLARSSSGGARADLPPLLAVRGPRVGGPRTRATTCGGRSAAGRCSWCAGRSPGTCTSSTTRAPTAAPWSAGRSRATRRHSRASTTPGPSTRRASWSGVPDREAYGEKLDFAKLGLKRRAMESYRGFVFVCFDQDIVDLDVPGGRPGVPRPDRRLGRRRDGDHHGHQRVLHRRQLEAAVREQHRRLPRGPHA